MSIRIKSISNCPSGEHSAVFCSSTIEKYPKGKRQILSFLIFGEDGLPKQNNMGENYYAVAVCNPSKGSNPKSKVHKVLKCMLTKEEYDPVLSSMTLPDIEEFLPNKGKTSRFVNIKVSIVGDEKKASVITHIERIRDKEWESIEGKFEGKYISIKQSKNPKELFEKLKHKIKNKYNLESAEMIMKLLIHKDAVFLDKKGNLISDFDITNIKSSYERERYPKLIKFLETENLDELFSFKE